MSTAYFDVQAALDTHLEGMPTVPPVAWENKTFEKPASGLYLRATFLPADTTGAALGAAGTDRNSGIYRIDIFDKSGNKKALSGAMADTIADRFKPLTELTEGTTVVQIIAVSRGAGITAGNKYQVPVTVQYQSYTAKR